LTVLADILLALKDLPPVETGRVRVIEVGGPALQGLVANFNGDEPKALKNKSATVVYPIVRTDEFPGWDIVDRVKPKLNLGGKRA